jgi:serine/threonine-protein kinase RsbW
MTDRGELHPANTRADIEACEHRVLGALERAGYSEAARFAVRLSLEEALVNAFMHGHRGLPPSTPVHVQYTIAPEAVRISITDQGPGFDPGRVPDPTSEENLELPSGRGLMLMRAYMTSVHHEDHGRTLVMTYDRGHAERAQAEAS